MPINPERAEEVWDDFSMAVFQNCDNREFMMLCRIIFLSGMVGASGAMVNAEKFNETPDDAMRGMLMQLFTKDFRDQATRVLTMLNDGNYSFNGQME